jgi:hypothetical protein
LRPRDAGQVEPRRGFCGQLQQLRPEVILAAERAPFDVASPFQTDQQPVDGAAVEAERCGQFGQSQFCAVAGQGVQDIEDAREHLHTIDRPVFDCCAQDRHLISLHETRVRIVDSRIIRENGSRIKLDPNPTLSGVAPSWVVR